MSDIETELKYLLNREDFHSLYHHLYFRLCTENKHFSEEQRDSASSKRKSSKREISERKNSGGMSSDDKHSAESVSLIRQVNYYFASPDSPLTQNPINIRIRFLGEKSELTCKIPIVNQITDVLQNSYEYNRQVSRKEALYYIKNGLSAKAQTEFFPEMLMNHSLQPSDLICYGHLRTARFHFPIKDGSSPILLDVNTYLGTFDYELEWELNPIQNESQSKQLQQANTFLKELFQKLYISPAGGLKPKRVRFLERFFSSTV